MSGRRKIVISIDGVGAAGVMPICLKWAFQLNDPSYEVHNFFWSHGYGRMLADLQDRKHISQKSEVLSWTIGDMIADQRQVSVVAKSGGTAVALEALARLEADSVDTVILLSPAVSPGYDLERPLRAVRNKMYAFNSHLDQFMLGLGTSIFGTADGIKTKAAGCVGFDDPDRYDKFQQIPWTPKMLYDLNFGTHWGTSMLPFLSQHVVPLLTVDSQAQICSD